MIIQIKQIHHIPNAKQSQEQQNGDLCSVVTYASRTQMTEKTIQQLQSTGKSHLSHRIIQVEMDFRRSVVQLLAQKKMSDQVAKGFSYLAFENLKGWRLRDSWAASSAAWQKDFLVC